MGGHKRKSSHHDRDYARLEKRLREMEKKLERQERRISVNKDNESDIDSPESDEVVNERQSDNEVIQTSPLNLSKNTEVKRRASNVGFIGLGNMGGFMATNLLSKGTKLSVYDVSKSAVDPIKGKGARVCSSPAEVASQSDLLFTMLPNNDIVREAYQGKDGVFSGAKKGTLLVDSSTISPDVAQSVGTAANDRGFQFIDAPVSGGVVGARDATLTFMVGGTKTDMARAEPYILQMGKRAVHCGNLGAGQVAKICNNMLLAISMIGVSESMNLGIRLGLDPKTLMDIINTSTGRCWSSEVYNPVPNLLENVPSSNQYAGGFSVQLVTKDLGLAQDVATKSHTPIPMGALAHQVYTTLTTKGLGDKDFAIIYDFLKQK